jgi:PAS domain S-box-containing protein
MLFARIVSAVSLSQASLFGLEGLLIALVIVRMARAIQGSRRSLATLNSSIRELGSVERQASRVDAALSRLEHASEDTALILLDRTGHISDWRTSATRLYGFDSCDMVGRGAATLFDQLGEANLPRLLTEARRESIRHTGPQVRAAGTTFAAEIEISPVVSGGSDGFSMVVHDLTRQQVRAAADWSAAETHAQLGAELAQAERRLSTLQDLTDPALNSFGDLEFVTELLGRLRTAVNAEGIALIHFGRVPHHVFCASNGLQCQRRNDRPIVAGAADTARTLMVHNDPSGVAELSAAIWPDDVSSLIAVPLVRSGAKHAVMEVVNRTGRRATEWEIALVQIVAGRIAWSLEDEVYRDSSASAWIGADSRPVPRTESGESLRLWLGEHLSDQGQSGNGQQDNNGADNQHHAPPLNAP